MYYFNIAEVLFKVCYVIIQKCADGGTSYTHSLQGISGWNGLSMSICHSIHSIEISARFWRSCNWPELIEVCEGPVEKLWCHIPEKKDFTSAWRNLAPQSNLATPRWNLASAVQTYFALLLSRIPFPKISKTMAQTMQNRPYGTNQRVLYWGIHVTDNLPPLSFMPIQRQSYLHFSVARETAVALPFQTQILSCNELDSLML